MATDPLSTLCDVVATHVARFPAPGAPIRGVLQLLGEALRAAEPRRGFTASPSRDYDSLLASALTGLASNLAPVAAALIPVRHLLPWVYHYAPRPGEADLCDRIAFAELIGPDGPMMAPRTRVGLTLVAPHTLYPSHAHPAVELYWVLSGTARWTASDIDQIAPPGQFVLHGSNESHAMRTSEQPLLALWAWSGDVDSPAIYL